jgi:hypothetical protein
MFGNHPHYLFEGFEVIGGSPLKFANTSEQMSKILLKMEKEFGLILIQERVKNMLGDIYIFKIKVSPDFRNRVKHFFKTEEAGLSNNELISQLESKENEIKKLTEENKNLSNELTKKEDSRIIKTQNKILCGLIKAHYKDKSSRVSKIINTLQREAGIEMNEKTLRTRLEEALKEDQSDQE